MKKGVGIVIAIVLLLASATYADLFDTLSEGLKDAAENKTDENPIYTYRTSAERPHPDQTRTDNTSKKYIVRTEKPESWEEELSSGLFDEMWGKLKDQQEVRFRNATGAKIEELREGNNWTVRFTNHTIKRIRLQGISKQGILDIDEPEIEGSLQSYAIDPSRLRFERAEATITAKGRFLYKCPTWNFTSQKCEKMEDCDNTKNECTTTGGWKKIMRLTPGQNYTIEFDAIDPAYAEYDATIGAPYCPTGESPCIAGSSMLVSRDSVAGTVEPNQPNTIDACTDGTSGTYQVDESVDNITIESLNGSYFRQGDTVRVNATFYCWSTVNDNLNYVYTNSITSPSWSVKTFTDPCPVAGFYDDSVTFTLDNVAGDQAIRVINQYNGATTTTCGGGAYDDNDDLAFRVYSRTPPNVTNITPAQDTLYDVNNTVRINATIEGENPLDTVVANITQPDGTITQINLSALRIGEVQSNITINGSWKTIYFTNTYEAPVVFASPLTFDDNRPAEVRLRNIGSTSFEIRAQEPTGAYPEADNHSDETISLLVVEEGIHRLSNGEFIEVHKNTTSTTSWGGSASFDTYSYSLPYSIAPTILSQVQTYNDPRFVTTTKDPTGTNNVTFNMALEIGQDNTTVHGAETIGWMAIKRTGATGNSTIDEMSYSTVLSDDTIRGRDNGCYAAAHGLGQVPAAVLGMQTTRDGGNGGWARYCNDVNTWTAANTYWTIDEVDNGERSHTTEIVGFIAFNSTGNITDNRYWSADYNQTAQRGRYNVTIIATDLPGNVNDTEGTSFIIPTLPNVTLVSPPNGTSTNNYTNTYICNATDDFGLTNITLNIWNSTGALKVQSMDTVSGKTNQSSFNIDLSVYGDGTYYWNCEARTIYTETAFAENNYTLTIDTTPPNVTITSPANGTTYASESTVVIKANVTSDGAPIDKVIASVTLPDSTVSNITMSTGQSTKTIDGDMSDWTSNESLGTGANTTIPDGWDLKETFGANDNNYFYGRLDVWGNGTNGIDFGNNYYHIFFDTDQNASTGFTQSGAFYTGYEYLLENGFFYNYSGTGGAWGWTFVGPITYAISTDNQSAEWKISLDNLNISTNISINVLFNADNGSAPSYIPDPYSSTIPYSLKDPSYEAHFNQTQQQGRYNFSAIANDTSGNTDSDSGYFLVIYNTSLLINTTADPVDNGQVFYYYADYEYDNGSDVLNANCTVQQLNATDIRYHNGLDDSDEIVNTTESYHASILDSVPAFYIGNTYTLQTYLAFNGTNDKNMEIWVTNDKEGWNSSQPYDLLINQSTNPEIDSTMKLINRTLNPSLFTSSTNYTIIMRCEDCNSTDFYRIGRDTDNFGHSYEAGGTSINWTNFTLESYEHMTGILITIRPISMIYNATTSRYERSAVQYLYSSSNVTYTYEVNCSKQLHVNQTNRSTLTVANNYAPHPNITDVDPDPALLGVDDVEVEWVQDVTGLAFGITSSYVNLTYPNGSFAGQYQGSPFTINTTTLNVAGTYNLTAYAENGIGSNTNITSFDVVYPAPLVDILTPLGETYDNYRAVTIAANVTFQNGEETVKANISGPASTEEILLSRQIDSDTFDNDTQWQNYTWDLAPGQQCTNEITAGRMRIKINGTGSGSETQCGFVAKKSVYGDFNATIDYNITTLQDKKVFVFLFTEEKNTERGYQVRINYERDAGSSTFVAAIEQADNYTTLANTTITETAGTIGISRQNNTFTFYYMNGSSQAIIAATNATLMKGLYPRIFSVSYTPTWQQREVYFDNFNLTSDYPDAYAANYENTADAGLYNVTIIANNTYGAVNDSEKTNFTINQTNTPPTIPLIYAPFAGETIYGSYNITWEEVDDFQNDSIQLNITLLDENGTYYQDIVTNLPNKIAPYALYEWNTSTVPNGRYRMRITAFENETAEGLSSQYTMPEPFIIDQEAPNVRINAPEGESYDKDSIVVVSANITDPDGISAAIAMVTAPNGSPYNITMNGGFDGDDFENDTLGTIWEKKSVTGPSQTCTVDIDTTIPGRGFANLTGNGLPRTATVCAAGSKKRVDGDFDLNATWYWERDKQEEDSAVLLSVAESEEADFGNRQLFVYYGNISGVGTAIRVYANDNGTTSVIAQVPMYLTNGTARIQREANNFSIYVLNQTTGNYTQIPLTDPEWNLSRALHVQVGVASLYSEYSTATASIEQVSVQTENTTFALFNYTSQLGDYNITIFANDTLTRVNDSETTNFTIININDPPSTPYILEPEPGDTLGGQYNITWIQVTDEEDHSVQFNITLLNPDGSFNATIVSDHGNINTTQYEWDTSLHNDGIYSLRIKVFENETAEGLSNSYTMLGNFSINNELPEVRIIAPNGETYDANRTVVISVNATSETGIQTAKAIVDTPNGTQYNYSLEQGQQSDDFSNNTLNTSWIKTETIGGAQVCDVDIDTTIPGEGFANLTGNGFPNTFSTCGIEGIRAVDGNFSINVTWNWESARQDVGASLSVVLSEQLNASFANRQIAIAYGNFSGGVGTATRIYANDNGTMEVITQVPKYIQNSTLRIERNGNNFTYYSCVIGGACQQIPVTRPILNLSRALYLQMGVLSTYPNYPEASASIDEVNIIADPNYFAIYNKTSETGDYNVSIRVEDTAGGVNDTETTNFSIAYRNSPPSVPYILAPENGDVWSLTNIIAWIQVRDDQGDPFLYNITLLNANESFNTTIISDYHSSDPTYTWDTTNTTDGIYSMKIKAFENETTPALANSNTMYGNFTINNLGPRVFNLTPENGSSFPANTTVLIGANVTDFVGVDTVYVNVTFPDSTSSILFLNNSYDDWWEVNFTDTIQDGQYSAHFIANDTYNKINDTEFTFFVVPNDAPNITVTGPPNGSVFIKNIFNITLNATVEDPNNDSLCVKIYASNTTPINENLSLLSRQGACYQNTIEEVTYNWTSPVIQPDDNTVMLLHFDNIAELGENTTHMYDYSGNGNNGSCDTGTCPTYTSGKIGAAEQFSGGEYVTVQDSATLDGMSELSIEAWINVTDVDQYQVVDKNQSYQLWADASGNIHFKIFSPDAEAVSTSRIDIEKWHLIQATYNGSEMRIYFDGVLEDTASRSGTVPDTGNSLHIGISSSITNRFDGIIDQVVIKNASLGTAEQRDHWRLHNGTWYWHVHADDGLESSSSGTYNINVKSNIKPTIDQVILNSTDGTDYTDENLTRYVINATDADNGKVKNITNWNLNGTSYAALNMPFEAKSWNETAQTKDYANGNDGKVYDAAFLRRGGYDGFGAYRFTGSEWINVTHSTALNISEEMTLEAWVYPTSFVSEGIIYAKPHTSFANPYVIYGIGYDTNNNYDIAIADGATQRNCPTASGTVNTNTWQHIVATFNGTTAKVYIDGQENSSCDFTEFSIATNTEPVYLGYYPYGGDAYNYEGRLDEVRIYDKALTAEQVLELYNNGAETIVSQETAIGETWQACVTPNDNREDGTEVCSNNLTIDNRPPTIQQVILNSTLGTNLTTENLTRYIINETDPDGDEVKNITEWFLNGSSFHRIILPFEANGGNETSWTKDYVQPTGRNITINGATWNRTGGYDGFAAYEYGGDGDNIRNNLTCDGATAVSVAVWVKSDATNTDNGIWIGREPDGTDSVCGLRYDTSGFSGGGTNLLKTGFTVNNGSGDVTIQVESANNTQTTDWQFLVTTWESGEPVRLYIDGVETAYTYQDPAATGGLSGTTGVRIGLGAKDTGGTGWDGYIDDFTIYSGRLSDEQILALYNNRTDLIVSNETSAGETWQACVTPNDNREDGTEVCSNNLTILGAPIAQNITDPLNDSCQKGYKNVTWISFLENGGGTVTYNVTLRNASTAAVIAIINGSTTLNYTPINYSNYTEGQYMIMVEGCNVGGLCSNSSNIFYIDYTAPNVTLNAPPAVYVNATTPPINVTFNCSATDNTRLVNISLYITDEAADNFAFHDTTSVNGTNATATFIVELQNGSYLWNCEATDCAGNEGFGPANHSVIIAEWTSVYAGQDTIEEFSYTNSSTYTEKIRVGFNATRNATFGLFSSFDIVKTNRNGTVDSVYARSKVDGVTIDEELMRDIETINDSEDAGLIPNLFNASQGPHNLTVEFLSNASFILKDIDLVLMEMTSAHNNTIRNQLTDADFIHTTGGATYSPSYNWTIDKVCPLADIFLAAKGTHRSDVTGTAISYRFLDLTADEESPTWEAIIQTANLAKSMGGNWIFESHTDKINMSIGARNYQTGRTTTVNMTIVDMCLADAANNRVNHFRATNPKANESSDIQINDTYYNIVSDNITIQNGTAIFVTYTGTFQLITGDTVPQNVDHLFNVTGTQCNTTKHRTLRGTLDAANIFVYYVCHNLTKGQTYQVNAWAKGAAGRSFNYYDQALSVFETTSFQITGEEVRPPSVIPNATLEGAQYLLNETAIILVNISDKVYPLDTYYATLTTPNGSSWPINLTNISTDIYYANWTEMLQKGRYNISFWANNSQGLVNDSQKTYFMRIPYDVIDIVDKNYTFLNYTTAILSNTSNILNLNVTVYENKVKSVEINTHYYDDWHSILVMDTRNPYENTTSSIYGVDTSQINQTSVNIWANSSGDSKLYKCLNWSMTNRTCRDGNWTFVTDIDKGDMYNFTLLPGDPGFLETSAAVDVALAPISNESFALAFIDQVADNLSFKILNTNGSVIVDTIVVDSSTDDTSRVSIGAINNTHFAIAWVDGPDDDLKAAIYNFSGTLITGPATLDPNIGLNSDVSVAQLGDRFIVCNANDADNDADYRIIFNNGTLALGESAVDANMNPSATQQNLLECTGVNSTRWTYFWYRAGFFFFFDQAREEILNEQGNTIAGPNNIDTSILNNYQVATTTLDDDKFALAWYDGADEDITIAVRDSADNVILAPTDIDTNVGADSRIAMATIRNNDTAVDDYFVITWWSTTNTDIRAAVYNSTGGQITAPFTVDSQPNANFQLIDATARDPITGNTICPGYFIVAYTNSTAQGIFKGFNVNGSAWDGVCGKADLIPLDIDFSDDNPDENQNITINATILNNGTATANNFIVQFWDGQCANGTQINGNITINQLKGGENTTVNVTWISFPVGPHNISVCVDVTDKVPESNETNNNLTELINVKAYNDYYGRLFGNVTLDTEWNETQYDWNSTDAGNMYFSDSDYTIDFEALQALGRNITGGQSTNDFLDADINLNTTGFNDSIQTLWAVNASAPKQTRTFIVRESTIPFVPYINSTNNSNFITGILWDTSYDTNGEYDTTDKEPLVFAANINRSKSGKFGTYDYEAHVPVLLRSYNQTTSQLRYYIELR